MNIGMKRIENKMMMMMMMEMTSITIGSRGVMWCDVMRFSFQHYKLPR